MKFTQLDTKIATSVNLILVHQFGLYQSLSYWTSTAFIDKLFDIIFYHNEYFINCKDYKYNYYKYNE